MNSEEKLDRIMSKLDAIETSVGNLETSVGNLETSVGNLETSVGNLETSVGNLEASMISLESDVSVLKTDVAALKVDVAQNTKDITAINLRLENEIRRDISLIAEGHLNLDRHFREANKSGAEFEMLSIRVGSLEARVNTLEKKKHSRKIK